MDTAHEGVLRQYVGDLIAVLDHVLQAVARQQKDDTLTRITHGSMVIEAMHATLTSQREALVAHGKTFGGASSGGLIKDALMVVTGAFAGLYGTMRGETASRMLRDDYTALSFLTVCTTMLHTTALACNDTATASLTLQFMREYPPLVMAVSEMLPHAVVADLATDKITISNANAATDAVGNLNAAWSHTP